MPDINKPTKMGKVIWLSPEDTLLKRLSLACEKYRTSFRLAEIFNGKKPEEWLYLEAWGLMKFFPDTRFSQGVKYLCIKDIPLKAQIVFFCLSELFLSDPLVPANAESFPADHAEETFHEGIEFLVGKGLAVAISVNKSEESKATKDNYLLSPEVCQALFRGRDNLIPPTIVSQFGTLEPWSGILDKRLVFPESLQERIRLIQRAISTTHFDSVLQGLKEQGFRSNITALFYGPPGTGKTEFVRQLARETQRSLFQVDSAKLDASYYGEKPRNVRDMFRMAKYASAICSCVPIVFIDEADGILGRRVELQRAADKEENTTVNIFLEELNSFSGILFAATNHIANIDPAMTRRFLVKVEFPLPDQSTLARIWQTKLKWLSQDEADILASQFPMSGAIIDNVVSMCLLEKIVEGKEPSLERIMQLCYEQGGKDRLPHVGFHQPWQK